MTPDRPNPMVITMRLSAMDVALTDLSRLAGVDVQRLRAEPLTRAAAERLIQVIVDLAFDINGHIVTAAGSRAPSGGRSSFDAVADAGVITDDLCAQLRDSAGLRNVLVHRYLEIDPAIVAASVDSCLRDYREYVRQVSAWLRR